MDKQLSIKLNSLIPVTVVFKESILESINIHFKIPPDSSAGIYKYINVKMSILWNFFQNKD